MNLKAPILKCTVKPEPLRASLSLLCGHQAYLGRLPVILKNMLELSKKGSFHSFKYRDVWMWVWGLHICSLQSTCMRKTNMIPTWVLPARQHHLSLSGPLI